MMTHDKFFGFTVSVSILNVSFGVAKASLLLPEFRSGDMRKGKKLQPTKLSRSKTSWCLHTHVNN